MEVQFTNEDEISLIITIILNSNEENIQKYKNNVKEREKNIF